MGDPDEAAAGALSSRDRAGAVRICGFFSTWHLSNRICMIF